MVGVVMVEKKQRVPARSWVPSGSVVERGAWVGGEAEGGGDAVCERRRK